MLDQSICRSVNWLLLLASSNGDGDRGGLGLSHHWLLHHHGLSHHGLLHHHGLRHHHRLGHHRLLHHHWLGHHGLLHHRLHHRLLHHGLLHHGWLHHGLRHHFGCHWLTVHHRLLIHRAVRDGLGYLFLRFRDFCFNVNASNVFVLVEKSEPFLHSSALCQLAHQQLASSNWVVTSKTIVHDSNVKLVSLLTVRDCECVREPGSFASILSYLGLESLSLNDNYCEWVHRSKSGSIPGESGLENTDG